MYVCTNFAGRFIRAAHRATAMIAAYGLVVAVIDPNPDDLNPLDVVIQDFWIKAVIVVRTMFAVKRLINLIKFGPGQKVRPANNG